MISVEEAQACLSRASFRIQIEEPDGRQRWATGFFICSVDGQADGTALTAAHNLPRQAWSTGTGSVRVRYTGEWYSLECVVEASNRQQDIGVMRLNDPPPGLIDGIPIAYIPCKSLQERRRFWAGRSVCVVGFPCENLGLAERLVDGSIDSAQPIVEIEEVDQDNQTSALLRRLRFLGNRAQELGGISGAAMIDRETGHVIGVQGSYEPSLGIVYGTEIAELACSWPLLDRYAHRLVPHPWKKQADRAKRQGLSRRVQVLALGAAAGLAAAAIPMVYLFTISPQHVDEQSLVSWNPNHRDLMENVNEFQSALDKFKQHMLTPPSSPPYIVKTPLGDDVGLRDHIENLGDQIEYSGGRYHKRIIANPSGVLVAFDAGQSLSEGTWLDEMLILVIEGEVELTVDGVVDELAPQESHSIPSGAPYELHAVTPAKVFIRRGDRAGL